MQTYINTLVYKPNIVIIDKRNNNATDEEVEKTN